MQSFRNGGWVRLPHSESAVPSGSIWLGEVDPTDVVLCTIRVRPGVRGAPRPSSDGLQLDDVQRVDDDTRSSGSGAPAADQSDLDRIWDFVSQTKLEIVEIDPERRSVVLSGTAAAIADAFHSQLARYKHAGKVRLGHVAPVYLPPTIAYIVEQICAFEDSSANSVPPATALNAAWHFMRRQSVVPLLALVLGSVLAVALYGRVTSERSTSSPSTTARPPQGFVPSLPPSLLPSPSTPSQTLVPSPLPGLLSLQELETAGAQSLASGRLQDAQDYFLRALAGDPSRPKAMQGLVAVRRKMAGDDPQIIQKQMLAYQDAIKRGSASGEYYTISALELLVSAGSRALREIDAQGERTALSRPTPTHSVVPDQPRPSPPSQRTQDSATRQPLHTSDNSTTPLPPRPTPQSPTQPASVPPKAPDMPTKAPDVQKPPKASTQGPPAPSAPAPVVLTPSTPQSQRPPVQPLPQQPAVTTPPPASPAPAPAPQASPPPPSLLYKIQIGPVSDDRATAIANRLSIGGFSQVRLGTEAGYRVVSEPLPRNDAENLVTTLVGRGMHGYIGSATGETVQIVFGVFPSQKDAEALSSRITAAGYEARVLASTVYTLRLGPYPSSSVNTITEIVKAGDPEAAVVADPVP